MLVVRRAAALSARAGRRRGLCSARGGATQQEYEAPVPVGRNLAVAGALAAFVGSVYFFTVQRLQYVRMSDELSWGGVGWGGAKLAGKDKGLLS
jgi:hypothetical protein